MYNSLRVLALLASVALPIANAMAADLDPPPPPIDDLRPATYDWSGVYVGGWVGNACVDGSLTDSTGTEFLAAGCGFKGGAMAGYNYQIQDWVLGVEVDYGFGSNIVNNRDPFADFKMDLDGIGTARAKIGYAFDDTMIFATGGLAYGNIGVWGRTSPTNTVSGNEDLWGWTIGGGIEHAITDALRVRLDYLYTDFGKNVLHPCSTCRLTNDWGGEHEVRVGASWAFDTF